MKIRTRTLGATVAFAAIALSIPTAVNAYADDPTPTIPVPVAPVPDPQGPGCDAYKASVPTGRGSFAGMAEQSASAAIASNPDLSTFSAALAGQLNPDVNLVSVLDGGPYNVFAPTDDAFAKLEPAEFEALKADPAKLTSVLYYHMALGYLGPDDLHGKLTSQQGAQLTVTGKGGDIKVDDTAKVVCGGITAKGAKIYMIDTVLNPDNALPAGATTTTSPTETSSPPTTSTTASPTETSAPEGTTASASATASPSGSATAPAATTTPAS